LNNVKSDVPPERLMVRASHRTRLSRLAVPVALIVVLVAAVGSYAFFGRAPAASPQRSSVNSPAAAPVSASVNQLVRDLDEMDVAGAVSFYSPNAVDVWSGSTGGLSGMYSGTDDIKLIYATTIGKATTVDANLSNYGEDDYSPTRINATFVIQMRANSTVAGIVVATIDVSQAWNWSSGTWQIFKENWTYTAYSSSFIQAGMPSEATTFPQWRVMGEGGNPNLVSEKSFEWHAGPYVAASVYAFLFGLVALFALRSRFLKGRETPKGFRSIRLTPFSFRASPPASSSGRWPRGTSSSRPE
jgi:hypothetical protein